MGVEKKNPFEDYQVHKISDGSYPQEKPLFCKKGKNLLISHNKAIQIYNTTTGEHMSELSSFPGRIICMQADPSDEDITIVSTANGQIFRKSLEQDEEPSKICQLTLDAEILNEQQVRKVLFKSNSSKTGKAEWKKALSDVKFIHVIYKQTKIWASWSTRDDQVAHLSVFDSRTGKQLNEYSNPAAVLQKTSENFVVGHDFVACMAKSSVHVMKLSVGIKRIHHIQPSNLKFTRIAQHPEESIFATGDSLGRITIWRNIFKEQPLRDIYHWHTLPVKSLVFTECGTHMFSGGEENVLVKWSLATRLKTFLPRLSSAIFQLSIANGSPLLSVSTTDAKILIINISLACVSTIQNFSRWSTVAVSGANGSILTQEPRTDALVLSGKTGHLQFLSTTDLGRFLYVFDVTQRNYISKERNIQPGNVEVTHAKFTRCGKWLVTAEAGPDEARLKFWSFNTEKQEYCLNSDVEEPHGSYGFYSLEVSSNELAVTTGPDGTFRLWGAVETTHLQITKVSWTQIGNSGYRQLPSIAADFARDGSLLAVSFGPTLTLWDTTNCKLKCSLTPPLVRDEVLTVKFGNHNLSHLVITGTNSALSCWNIVTLCRQWVVPVNVTVLISDPNSRYMCAFTKNRNLFIFDPSSPQPELRLEKVCDAPITAAHFVANADAPFLYFLSQKQVLYFLGRTPTKSSTANHVEKITPFSAQLAKNIKKDVISAQGLNQVTSNLKKFNATILDSPAHTLPHISLFCEDVLSSLLLTVNISDNSHSAIDNRESTSDSIDALPLPANLGEAELDVEVDHLFVK